MLGAITGDTVGSVHEFLNTKDYDFRLLADSNNFTDDSVMTVAVAEWLLRDPSHSYQTLEEVMLEYEKQYPSPLGGYGGGFHTWLFHPERLYRYDPANGHLPYESTTSRHPYGSWGNGSAMWASAVGWFFDTLEETERVAEITAAITHNHPEGIKGAQATAAAIWMARKGKNKEEIRDYIESRFGYDLHKTYEYWHPIYEWDSSCQGTVPQAIICVLDSKDFEDAIRKAVSLGGDSDTLACITGGIAEAFYCGVPKDLATKVLDILPEKFHDVLMEFQEKTDYGVACPIDDYRVNRRSEVKKKRVATANSRETFPMPEMNVKLPMDLRLTDEQMSAIIFGHIPSGMDDNWFMYCGDNKIRYFSSHSGVCIFEANFEQRYSGYEVTVLTVNQDPGEYKEDPEAARALFCALLMEDCGEDATPFWDEYKELSLENTESDTMVLVDSNCSGHDGKPIKCSYKVFERFYAGEYPGDKTLEAAQLKLQLFLDCGITHFIDLTEEDELEPYAQLLPAGISYRRFPIRDVSIPKDVTSVKLLIDEIDTILSNPANKLYLHCWGGVGRTGTIVGCWYASHSGMKANVALQKTREAFDDCPKSKRRHIPETAEQIAFIGEFCREYSRGTTVWSSESLATNRPYEYSLDKVKGCIIGGAVGDALGYAVEFLDNAYILSAYGPNGITRYRLDHNGIAEFSDDTQMTLFTATGLLAAETELNLRGTGGSNVWSYKVANHYVDWYWTQNSSQNKKHVSWLFEIPELHNCRAPGMTCMGSLRDIVQGVDKKNNSKGCGGVMRVAPVAICHDLRESMDAGFMYTLGGAVADITHNNPLGFMPAAMLVMLLDKIIKCGEPVDRKVLQRLVMSCISELGKVRLHDEGASDTYDKYPAAVGTMGRLMMFAADMAFGDLPDEECIRELGGGWTGDEALAIAVYCALRHTDSFEDAVVAAVNHSGDSDSTGAICGNIMGLIHGYDAIPAHFKERLELLPVLEEVATDLYTGSANTDDLKAWKRKYLEGHRV